MKESILEDYNKKKTNYDSFGNELRSLILKVVKTIEKRVHQVTYRIKDEDSLSKKIDAKLGKYNSIDDITDIVGVRIITYLESDVDILADLIKEEFEIDKENSVDKRELNSDQFGYRSLHLVVSLNDSRIKLAEYSSYKDLKCEIQIRSILQHAWAEIEHDLGYKGKVAVPKKYKRSFNRLSALLETADQEFDRLKKDLLSYESEVQELIKNEPQNVAIDQVSLIQFNLENDILKEAREYLANLKGWRYEEGRMSYFLGLIERFEFFGIKTIKEINDLLIKNKEEFFIFLDVYTKRISVDEINIIIVLLYFQHFLVAKSEDPEKILDYLHYGEFLLSVSYEYFIDVYSQTKKRLPK